VPLITFVLAADMHRKHVGLGR